jgi:molybdate transport system ATP-binding protein
VSLRADFARRFPDGHLVEAAFELDLDRYGITVLFGASGCGKTTILRCLAGLDRPDSGFIENTQGTWCDVAKSIFVPPQKRHLGFVLQEPALFPHLRVEANVAYGLHGWPARDRAERLQDMLALAGLEGLEHRRPHELSGGQKQRVALARALAPRPRLLLLDEPFASLDAPAAAQLRDALRRMLQAVRLPAILVTHDREEALSLGDRLLLVEEGRIHRSGSPAELLADPVASRNRLDAPLPNAIPHGAAIPIAAS